MEGKMRKGDLPDDSGNLESLQNVQKICTTGCVSLYGQ